MNSSFDLLLGRKTFDIWEPFWPKHADEWPAVNTVTKYVASNTRTSSEWQPSVFLNGDIAEKVARLKQEQGYVRCWKTGVCRWHDRGGVQGDGKCRRLDGRHCHELRACRWDYNRKLRAIVKPDFDAALTRHFEAISKRDMVAFKSHLTKSDTLYTIVQNGHAFTTPAETIEIHEEWFKDPNWVWEGSVVHKVVGEDVAMALVKYQYRARPEDKPVVNWLTYVFQLQDGEWRIVHDQSTALDFVAFARMAGIEVK
jgi:hypothetical protein